MLSVLSIIMTIVDRICLILYFNQNVYVLATAVHLLKKSTFMKLRQARVRQGSARDGPLGKRPQSLNPCLELTLKLVARWGSGGIGGGKGSCVGSLWITLGSL